MSTLPRSATARHWWLPAFVLAALVYVPLLLTSPGQVVADTKTYLYLDPGRLLGRALSMWDPHVGLGTVPHQQIGYLWPMGPYYWVMEQIGVPDWAAQRLWIGSIMVAAGGGVLFLGRTWRWRPSAAAAAAFVYALSPFVLTLAARISVILLPFAGLPWMLALTVRALRTRGWRHPALFGLTVATVGSVNATALVLVGLVPLLWIAYAVWGSREVSSSRALNTVGKMGLVTVAVNLWWIGGLSVQATNGIDILRYTETAEVVARASTAPEVLRGLGYWFFYGGDRLGPWIEPSVSYTQDIWLIALTYLIPVLGVFALGVVRWRNRAFVVGMLLLGTVIAVGAHPWDDPSPVGAVIKAFLLTDAGLAMRSLPRAVPIVALAIALGIGSLVGAAGEQVSRRALLGAVAVALVAYAALPPLWTRDMVPENLRRPEGIPDYWMDAAEYLEAQGHRTRVLAIPGIDFASYRWGNTVDPITPGLMDRPYVARELIPYGSEAAADLLNALDLRLQEGTMGDTGLATVARVMAAGDILMRNDLQYERFNTPRPRSLWALVNRTDGLGDPTEFGPAARNEPVPEAGLLDELHLAGDGSLPDPPAVAVFPVEGAEPIVKAEATSQMVFLSGSGEGIVDAAMAGLLRGTELIRYSASVTGDEDFVREGLVDQRGLIVTDTNRQRAERWTTIRHTQGYTEQIDGGLLRDDHTDNRLPVADDRPSTRTVAEHRGIEARATGYGNPITYTPEERPANAIDGDPTTAWRVAAFDEAVGHRLELTSPSPIRADHVVLQQPTTGQINRWITEVELRFDGEDPFTVELGEASRRPPGQRIDFGERVFETLSIEIEADTAGPQQGYGGFTSVGFADIDLAGLELAEFIRMPSDLLDAAGFRSVRYPLAIVQTRLRSVDTDVTRSDEELAMRRALALPVTREYTLRGTARLSAEAPAPVLDALLGRPGPDQGSPRVTASGTLPGGLRHLPANALDGDPTTAWTTEFGSPVGSSVTIETPEPVLIERLSLSFLDGPERSRPTAVRVVVDGEDLGTYHVDRATPIGEGILGASFELMEPVTGSSIVLQIADAEIRTTIDWNSGNARALPVSIVDVAVADLAVDPVGERIDTGCREDLVTVDGRPIPVQITGAVADALAGRSLELTACTPAVLIPAGDTDFVTAQGRSTGLDLDQLVWRSAAGGGPFVADLPILPEETTGGPTVRVVDEDDTTVEAAVTGAEVGRPFWLVLGQSHNDGWQARTEGAEVDGPHLVNGYANGFLVSPTESSFEVTMRFVPQNRVDVALLVSAVGVLGALVLSVLPAREIRPAPIPLQEPLRRIRAFSYEGALPTRHHARLVGLGTGIAAALVVNPLAGIVVGLLAGFTTRREGWRPIFTVLPAALLAGVAVYVVAFQLRNDVGPGLHWPGDTGRLHPLGLLAVVMLAVDVVIANVWAQRSEFR